MKTELFCTMDAKNCCQRTKKTSSPSLRCLKFKTKWTKSLRLTPIRRLICTWLFRGTAQLRCDVSAVANSGCSSRCSASARTKGKRMLLLLASRRHSAVLTQSDSHSTDISFWSDHLPRQRTTSPSTLFTTWMVIRCLHRWRKSAQLRTSSSTVLRTWWC